MQESVFRRLRLLGLQAAVAIGDSIAEHLRRPPELQNFPKPSTPGVSIVIPARGSPDLLASALESVAAAGKQITEPIEIIVVVNGSPASEFSSLSQHYPDARWLHFRKPLAFAEAIRHGTRAAHFDWIYLANSDVVLDRDALAQALRWRAPHVFAIASEILPAREGERREETGWTELTIRDGLATISDMEPQGMETRGTVYAGGGASLFQKVLLARYLEQRDPYRPFYWEDVEWGVRAWMDGYQALFCPASKARHQRRATVSRFYPPEEIDRIFRRNALQFQLRNLSGLGSIEKLWTRLMESDDATFRELVNWRNTSSVLRARVGHAKRRYDDSILRDVHRSYHIVTPAEFGAKPVIAVVSPYAVYPPGHGGAIRIYQLLRRLARDFHIVLLSDEAGDYSAESATFFRDLAAVHFVSGRPEPKSQDRINRIVSHSHKALRQALSLLLEWHDPRLVDIEFIELALLISERKGRAPWLISLHDVLFDAAAETEEDRYERALVARYDVAVAASQEDLALLGNNCAWLVSNGVDIERLVYRPSSGAAVLFAGPFRYLPNFLGIRRFLELVYPHLLAEVPTLEVWLLGGVGAIDRTAGIACFRQRGVLIYDDFTDPYPFLERCAVTINPLSGIRGSSIKLIESLAAGRVVVSTTDGARGFLNEGFRSLITVERVEDFLDPLVRLLRDEDYREALEQPPAELLEKYSWNNPAMKMAEIYNRYIHGDEKI